jgi:hypothetical protein
MQLILSEMFLSKLIRTFAEIGGEILNGKQICTTGLCRVVSTLEFFQHPLS